MTPAVGLNLPVVAGIELGANARMISVGETDGDNVVVTDAFASIPVGDASVLPTSSTPVDDASIVGSTVGSMIGDGDASRVGDINSADKVDVKVGDEKNLGVGDIRTCV